MSPSALVVRGDPIIGFHRDLFRICLANPPPGRTARLALLLLPASQRPQTGWRQPCSEPPRPWSSARGPDLPPVVESPSITPLAGGRIHISGPGVAHSVVVPASASSYCPAGDHRALASDARSPSPGRSAVKPAVCLSPIVSATVISPRRVVSLGVATPSCPIDVTLGPAPPSVAPPPLAPSDTAPPLFPARSPSPPAAVPLVEPPQGLHPLVPPHPAPVARFPPPRGQSPPLLPDAPDPKDDKTWWNGELW
ncbi:unnamed protein product [Closterium sp. NIES-65]|nr:unnamed protein product [Closterium sp. NIES-65]